MTLELSRPSNHKEADWDKFSSQSGIQRAVLTWRHNLRYLLPLLQSEIFIQPF